MKNTGCAIREIIIAILLAVLCSLGYIAIKIRLKTLFVSGIALTIKGGRYPCAALPFLLTAVL